MITNTGGVIFFFTTVPEGETYKSVRNTIVNFFVKFLPNSSGYNLK